MAAKRKQHSIKGFKKTIGKKVRKFKQRRHLEETYSLYIYRVLKQFHPYISISAKAMNIMNSFVNDIFETIAKESSRLAHYTGRVTISRREIKNAVRLVVPGEPSVHANNEGDKSLAKYDYW